MDSKWPIPTIGGLRMKAWLSLRLRQFTRFSQNETPFSHSKPVTVSHGNKCNTYMINTNRLCNWSGADSAVHLHIDTTYMTYPTICVQFSSAFLGFTANYRKMKAAAGCCVGHWLLRGARSRGSPRNSLGTTANRRNGPWGP